MQILVTYDIFRDCKPNSVHDSMRSDLIALTMHSDKYECTLMSSKEKGSFIISMTIKLHSKQQRVGSAWCSMGCRGGHEVVLKRKTYAIRSPA